MSDFADANVVKRGEHKYDVNYGSDKGLFVEFDTMPEKQEFLSEEAGRPIFKDIEIVRIYKPGVNQPTIRKVQATASSTMPSDYDRWPQAYAAFKNKAVIVHEGTALESWPPLTKSDVLNFKAANIHTVEQLAEVPDTALDGLGHGSRTIRDKAIAFLAAAGGKNAIVAKQAKEIENLKTDLEAMKNQLAALGKEPETDTPKQKKGNKVNG